MRDTLYLPQDYAAWLGELKKRIRNVQQRSSLAVNRELIQLYWQIGCDILSRQNREGWGSKVIERLAKDLRSAFPGMKGFSRANLMYMRAFAEAWPSEEIVQQVVGQLPWGHNLLLLTKLKSPEPRLAYAKASIHHGWSRNTLSMQIERRSLEREGQALTNFHDLFRVAATDQSFTFVKDPYLLDFLGVGDEVSERVLEDAIVQHITRFLLELGSGFAFLGRQIPLEVGGDDFFIDLLFYHVKLRCYVVVELKACAFKREHLGQLAFYLTAVDRDIKNENDNPTIGLLLCKSKNGIVAEYALADKHQPMGIAEYQLVQSPPIELQTSLPSTLEIQEALRAMTE